ncbi:hypothetical protein ANN_24419 [Periplaneta americana]|uniref:Uncharacterized protein n=1 Tax=Periplaneta americana TaxID=6978 RepID=A0ABQ8S320_PERAM|nr:hypothetical protein ANN_24419 [Periplaneta americana]
MFFKSLKTKHHKNATEWVHRHPNENLSKIRFCLIFSEAWTSTAFVGAAVKGFQCTGIFPFNDDIVPEEKFEPAVTFISSNNDAGNNAGHAAASTKNGTSTKTSGNFSSPKRCSSSPEDTIKNVLPSPLKKELCRKRKVQTSVHLTSPQNIDITRVKRCRNETKNKNKIHDDKRSSAKRKCVGVIKESPKQNDVCGFCLLNFYSPESIRKGTGFVVKGAKCGIMKSV